MKTEKAVEVLVCFRCPGRLRQHGPAILRCRKCGALYTEGVIKELRQMAAARGRPR